MTKSRGPRTEPWGTPQRQVCEEEKSLLHWAWAVAQKPFDAAAHQSFTRQVAASHLVSPSRLQVARQSYILEVSHIHLCGWRRSLPHDVFQPLAAGILASCLATF